MVPFVPVEAAAVAALEDALEKLDAAERALRGACEKLGELGDDLCSDAISRLEERGASEAQIEGYEEGWRLRRRELDLQLDTVRSARVSLADAIARVRG